MVIRAILRRTILRRTMLRHISLWLVVGLSKPVAASSLDCVILLHGLMRSPGSMTVMENALVERGFIAVNAGYPSRSAEIAELAVGAISKSLARCPQNSSIHFVTHSLGGILLRQYVSEQPIPALHRVVMLGPPNQGSEVVDKLGRLPGFGWINGPAGPQLGTDANSVPRQLGEVSFELGVIAGTRSINWILSTLIPGRDDGKVSVENTRVQGMADHLVLPSNHAMMMRDAKVIEQVIHFLKQGQFYRLD